MDFATYLKNSHNPWLCHSTVVAQFPELQDTAAFEQAIGQAGYRFKVQEDGLYYVWPIAMAPDQITRWPGDPVQIADQMGE